MKHFTTLLPFVLTAALAGGAGAPPPKEVTLPIPGPVVKWTDHLPAATPVEALQLAVWVGRYTNVVCASRLTDVPAYIDAPHPDAGQSLRTYLGRFLHGADAPESGATARAWIDQADGQPIGVLVISPKENGNDEHAVQLVLPDRAGKGKMVLITCVGTGPVNIRASARPLAN